MKVTGDYINYSMTVIDTAPHKEEAIDFICFIISEEGREILKKNGQEPVIPFTTEQPDQLPSKLREYLSRYK
jgi:ABC-type Fe3+ transport system substrate-binding protein